MRVSKCTCSVVARPVRPVSPIGCPAFTVSPLRKAEPDIPYYTIEVEPGGTIRQHRSYLDEEPGVEEIRGFLREWQREIKNRLTKEDHRLASVSVIKRQKNIDELKEKNNTRVLKCLEEDFMEAI